MHALLVTARVEPGREEEGLTYLRESVLPQLDQLPGLVAGYWLETKDGESLAVVLFEEEQAARRMAEDGLPNLTCSFAPNLLGWFVQGVPETCGLPRSASGFLTFR